MSKINDWARSATNQNKPTTHDAADSLGADSDTPTHTSPNNPKHLPIHPDEVTEAIKKEDVKEDSINSPDAAKKAIKDVLELKESGTYTITLCYDSRTNECKVTKCEKELSLDEFFKAGCITEKHLTRGRVQGKSEAMRQAVQRALLSEQSPYTQLDIVPNDTLKPGTYSVIGDRLFKKEVKGPNEMAAIPTEWTEVPTGELCGYSAMSVIEDEVEERKKKNPVFKEEIPHYEISTGQLISINCDCSLFLPNLKEKTIPEFIIHVKNGLKDIGWIHLEYNARYNRYDIEMPQKVYTVLTERTMNRLWAWLGLHKDTFESKPPKYSSYDAYSQTLQFAKTLKE